jgi:hypothetical protein
VQLGAKKSNWVQVGAAKRRCFNLGAGDNFERKANLRELGSSFLCFIKHDMLARTMYA